LAVVLATAAVASATTYTLTDLGILASTTGYDSYAMGVNDYGVVAGASCTSKGSSAKIVATTYTPGPGAAWVNIGTGFNTFTSTTGGTFATGINDNDQVAGWLRGTGGTNSNSFIYNTSTQTYTSIAAQPGVCNGVANQCGSDTTETASYTNAGPINSSGQIAGEYTNTAGNQYGFIWNGSSTTNVPQETAYVSGINNSGVVVGAYGSLTFSGFYYSGSGGGSVTTITKMAYPEAVVGNEVVGADYVALAGGGYGPEAAIYTLGNSSATYIGAIGTDTSSTAYAVSSSGTVVGQSYGAVQRAFIYNSGVMTDLNTLIPGGLGAFSELNVAMGISPNGEYIVGDGTIAATGYTHGFLLTAIPTPEPSTLLLAVSGIFGLLAYAWRKRI
jgi:probable HAF family extracellular repeat protein